ncbi:MAG TPA: bifunctional phosphoglucose/phosphomannose isomerase [Candidatus Kapabacteria bacterium]|nr:bifunctional phosphoglucose/phosphomannose isomerase [Candidatus Kapabacteria bacterium]
MELNFQVDSSNMRQVLADYHFQVRESIAQIKQLPKFADSSKINKIFILGMGGSAISGDLANSIIKNIFPEIDIPIFIIREYDIPNFLDNCSLVIAISYSGNTEETLSAFEYSRKRTNHLLGIASGGTLENLCKTNNIPFIQIPSGYQPRAALGYLFFNLLNFLLLNFCKICTLSRTTIEEQIIADLLEEKSKVYSQLTDDNPALNTAKKIYGKIPIIYSSSNVLNIVNIRFRGQIQENAKYLAFGNLIPEMNHNEINSWKFPKEFLENFFIIYLLDKSDHPQVQKRIFATKDIIDKSNPNSIILQSNEDSLFSRIFDLIYLGDWTSYYLAILNNQDPTPVPVITEFKKIIATNN